MSKIWAQALLRSSAVILDTETSGVDKAAQVIQLCVIDMRGNTLFDSLFRPSVEIHPSALSVHHITKYRLRSAPLLTDVIDEVQGALSGRTAIAYNASFDKRMLGQTLRAFRLDMAWFERLDWQCAMRKYAEHLGVRNAPKLQGGDHSALGDCLATLKILRTMAEESDRPAIDLSGNDITDFVGSAVTAETLTVLHAETKRRYGDSWQLFAELADADSWRVTGLRALATTGREVHP